MEVDGLRIRRGTSVYHTREHRVLWVDKVTESAVQLSSVDRSAEIGREAFTEKIRDGTLVVEATVETNKSR